MRIVCRIFSHEVMGKSLMDVNVRGPNQALFGKETNWVGITGMIHGLTDKAESSEFCLDFSCFINGL